MRFFLFFVLLILSVIQPLELFASESTETPSLKKNMTCLLCKIWNTGSYSLIIPVNTWHNRRMYDKRHTDSYNERPWGIGFSKDYTDSNNNRHSLFFMEFQDSHNHIEPFAGYAYNKIWALDKKKDLRVSVGGILGITAREEYSYIPFPAPLPMIGLEYKRLIFESTYIPGTKNNGNVLFTWARWRF